MPIVTMPVFSLYASGTLGKTLTYKYRNKKFVVGKYQLPPSSESELQRLRRLDFKNRWKRHIYWRNRGNVVQTNHLKPDFYLRGEP